MNSSLSTQCDSTSSPAPFDQTYRKVDSLLPAPISPRHSYYRARDGYEVVVQVTGREDRIYWSSVIPCDLRKSIRKLNACLQGMTFDDGDSSN
jgi:hypothetical protein